MYNNGHITGDQMKAIKAVEKAMKDAHKLGVGFWGNYGMICAFNANQINCPVPDQSAGTPLTQNMYASLSVKNFHGSNADDSLFVEFK